MALTGYQKQKNWRYNAKRKLVEAFGQICACCGLKDHPIAYDFHHLDESKKEFGLSSLSGHTKGWNKIVIEAKKCMMLCSICHRKHHSGLVILPKIYNTYDESKIVLRS